MTNPDGGFWLCDAASQDDADYELLNALETQQEVDEAEREMLAELDYT